MENTLSDHLFLREGTTYSKIHLGDIEYIQADGNYCYIQTPGKRYAVKRSLSSIEDELDTKPFVRASRGILVNFNNVSQVNFNSGVIYVGEHELKLGKTYHMDIKERMPRL